MRSTNSLAMLRFLEYHTTDLAGAPLDVTKPADFSKQLSDSVAAQLMEAKHVFGSWQPPVGH